MSSAKLYEVLSAQKHSFDKIDLGYAVSSGPSSSTAFGSRTVFVPHSEKGDKGMIMTTRVKDHTQEINPIRVYLL